MNGVINRLYLTASARGLRDRMNKLELRGQPCLVPLSRTKREEMMCPVVTHAVGEFGSF